MFIIPPGAAGYTSEVLVELNQIYQSKKPEKIQRTRHRDADGTPRYVNHLIKEKSPYLRQHAHNPVGWRPWNDESFALAEKLDRPILLSVGYSTCHWCHVMEEESFEDEEIAAFLNSNFIPIKVDREEKPDVDSIYMKAVQMMTGQGGWPMTVCLTPDRKPFFGGTYFPARDGDRGGIGFLSILRRLDQVYRTQRGRVTDSSEQLTALIRQSAKVPRDETVPGAEVLHRAFEFYHGRFDERFGGMIGAPKFPSSLPVRFLLRYANRSGNRLALEMAEKTLLEMARGGMYDQIGGGFHRYSTDERWLVPHFEKMLYDNALLTVAYLEAWQMTGNREFAEVVKDILNYVLREMTSPEGAFYSATDADSLNDDGEPEEGFFFTWKESEVRSILSAEEFEFAKEFFNFSQRGNYEGRNIPFRQRSILDDSSVVAEVRRKLYEARLQKTAPQRDEKILVSWNALMISAFARAGFTFEDQTYIDAASRASEYLFRRMMTDEKQAHASFENETGDSVYLDDYAFLLGALLDLFEATQNRHWMDKAAWIRDGMIRHFHDESEGGFFLSRKVETALLSNEKPAYDGAEPSGNSIAALSLLRLFEYTNDPRDREAALSTLRAFSARLRETPYALSEMLSALDHYLDRPVQIVLLRPSTSDDNGAFLLQPVRTRFLPNHSLIVTREGESLPPPFDMSLIRGKTAAGRVTAYVCRLGMCLEPTQEPETLAAQLSEPEKY